MKQKRQQQPLKVDNMLEIRRIANALGKAHGWETGSRAWRLVALAVRLGYYAGRRSRATDTPIERSKNV